MSEIPYGFCQCGCGEPAPIAKESDHRFGAVKGEPRMYARGHARRGKAKIEHVVDPETGCWNWSGSKTTAGYGHFHFRRKLLYTHRYYYEQHVGPIPEGLELDHLCRNRGCCNPEHLEPVTHAENMRRSGEARRQLAV